MGPLKRNAPLDTPEDATGVSLGLTYGKGRQPYLAGMSTAARAVAKMVRKQLEAVDPHCRFTSLQATANGTSSLHVDGGNWGPSKGVAIGPYVGAALHI